jgi:catechol 2,3-dioxygenase-like lactoylglutathione lyase family enzyme
VDYTLELVVVPVTDVDKSKDFYANQMGFNVDVDHQPNENFRVVQLTPPGSACSITIGKGISDPSTAGLYKGLHLCVSDLEAARDELVARGVAVSEPYHFGAEGQTPGLSPERASYASFCDLADPDGNTWLLQEVKRG